MKSPRGQTGRGTITAPGSGLPSREGPILPHGLRVPEAGAWAADTHRGGGATPCGQTPRSTSSRQERAAPLRLRPSSGVQPNRPLPAPAAGGHFNPPSPPAAAPALPESPPSQAGRAPPRSHRLPAGMWHPPTPGRKDRCADTGETRAAFHPKGAAEKTVMPRETYFHFLTPLPE
ncbi:splicing factor 3A subunit 2-like [Alligator mississippiensis]|uniref:splicing factor 3A subunit 2-like n=1 Tax=Alligator mississippiensis TaxID=8496 RepID=UPI002877BF78|nr:splicing factor 3A subunit 2-like [Alligator mississippiensis]